MDSALRHILLSKHAQDDVLIALQAATRMADMFREDFVIMSDLSVKKLSECEEPPLEIIRYNQADDWRHKR